MKIRPTTIMSTLLATTTRNIGKLVPTNTVMMLCDIQERFRPLIYNSDTVVQTAKLMTQVSMKLDIPCIVTEQYPKAFGSTCIDCFEDVDAFIQTNGQPIAKKMFSMMVPEVRQKLSGLTERKSVLLFGVEAHVCVQQTALDLIEEGYDVHVILDGTSSQVKYDREVSLERMKSSGVFLTTAQSAIFMLMQSAEHPNFKEISKMVVETAKLPNQFNE